MLKEIIETGKTVDAAIDSACEKLGCDRENCNWEIIDLPKKGFLGLKNFPAKVRVSIEVPDEKPKQAEQPRRDKTPRQEKPQQEKKPQPPRKEAEARPQQQLPREKAPEKKPLVQEERTPVTEGFTPKEESAKAYINSLLAAFGLTAQLNVSRGEGDICIDIVGEGLGVIIGRRGETLDAIQYLTGLVVNRLEGEYLRVTIDCGDYRTKRRETLEALAKKLAGQVLKTNVSKTLEPMNPFERRIIHATVSEIEGVSSTSIGEEPNRRVVITSPTAKSRPPRRDGRGGRDDRGGSRGGGRGRDDRGGRGGRDRDRGGRVGDRRGGGGRSSAPAAPAGPPKETPEAGSVGALYGKVDLD